MKVGDVKENSKFCYLPLRLSNGSLVWLDFVHEKWGIERYWENETTAMGRNTVYKIEKLKWVLLSRTTF